MEVNNYTTPTSWDDKGMDWNNPSPARADYVMAIRQALMERAAAVHESLPRALYGISPYKAVSREALAACARALEDICPHYVNIDTPLSAFKDDLTDFPKMWTYADLVNGTGFSDWAWCGEACRFGVC